MTQRWRLPRAAGPLGFGIAAGAVLGVFAASDSSASEGATPPVEAVTISRTPPAQPGQSSSEDRVQATDAPARMRSTPLSELAAGRTLADAWTAVVGLRPKPESVAVVWAHWALETGRGRRMIGYNFAGLKGRAPNGHSIAIRTHEHVSGRARPVVHRFRAYDFALDGAVDYLRLLRERYPRAFSAAKAGHPLDFADALENGGYFTGDGAKYRAALSRIAIECLKRGLARRALELL